MKKFSVVLLISLVFLTLSVAFSAEPQTITFTFWGNPQMADAFQKLADLFEKENPDIKVNRVLIPSKYYDKLLTMIAGGTAPDVAMLAFDKVPAFVEKGVLQPIDSYIDKLNYPKTDLFKVVVDSFSYKGKLYGVPRSFSPFVLFYNKDLFKNAGLKYPDKSWTWSEFLVAAKKTTKVMGGKTVQWGFAGNYEEDGTLWPEWLFPFIWQNKGDIVSADGESLLTSPKTVEAIRFYVDLIHKHKVAPTPAQAQTFGGSDALFYSGKAAMIMESYVIVASARTQKGLNFDMAPLPHRRARSTVAFPIGYVMPKAAKNPDAAARFMTFIAGPEGQKLIAELGIGLPGLKSIAKTDAFLQPGKPPEHSYLVIEEAEYAKPLPAATPNFSQWYEAFTQGLAPVIAGNKTLDDVLPQLNNKIEEILKQK